MGVLFNLPLYGSLLCISLFLQQSWHQSAAGGQGLALQVPLSVAAASLLAAVGLAWVATRPG